MNLYLLLVTSEKNHVSFLLVDNFLKREYTSSILSIVCCIIYCTHSFIVLGKDNYNEFIYVVYSAFTIIRLYDDVKKRILYRIQNGGFFCVCFIRDSMKCISICIYLFYLFSLSVLLNTCSYRF